MTQESSRDSPFQHDKAAARLAGAATATKASETFRSVGDEVYVYTNKYTSTLLTGTHCRLGRLIWAVYLSLLLLFTFRTFRLFGWI